VLCRAAPATRRPKRSTTTPQRRDLGPVLKTGPAATLVVEGQPLRQRRTATNLLVRIRRAAGARPERRGRASELLLAASVLGLAVGGTLHLTGLPDGASLAWALTTVVGIVPLLGSVVAGLRRRELGVDLIALLAMAGAVLLDEYLAGAVIALMLASGRTLEARASGRASRELRALLQRAPRNAHRYQGGELVLIDVGQVARGDRLLVMQGEVIPVDGRLAAVPARHPPDRCGIGVEYWLRR
jgi:cation transport ATPase